MAPSMELRVAVLASGEGTNLQAILDDPVLRPHVVLVVSDRPEARALRRAEEVGVEALLLSPADHEGRLEYDRALREALESRAVDVIVLAGFMRILGPELVKAFPDRIVNVHPALLPAFPGTEAIAQALDWGSKVTGVTVHLVDEEVDHGPIVMQEAVSVEHDDDESTLAERIHAVEHRLLPAAIRALLEGRLQLQGRRVRIEEDDSGG